MGHLNRANPQWQELKSGCEALVIFFGPNSYVSPTHYGFEPAAPTWDFATVHLRGQVTPIDDQEASLNVVLATVRNFEERFGRRWNPKPSLEYFRTILPAVGAFFIEVSGVESMFKLSQEQDHATRERVCKAFAESGDSMQQEVANLIVAQSEFRKSR
jgi:transcriptional regulator